MDSFYDTPRRVPNPTLVEKLKCTPSVPEVSLLNPSDVHANKSNFYDTWRYGRYNQALNANTENIKNGIYNANFCGNQSSQLFRKQVRFESPTTQQRPSLTYEPFVTRNNTSINNGSNSIKLKSHSKQNKSSSEKTFEEIYMANIPNRHLDLSIIELPNITENSLKSHSLNCKIDTGNKVVENKENEIPSEMPKTYKEFLETQRKIKPVIEAETQRNSVTDIFNYKRPRTEEISIPERQHSCERQIENYEKKLVEPVMNIQKDIVHNKYDFRKTVDKPLQNEGLKFNPYTQIPDPSNFNNPNYNNVSNPGKYDMWTQNTNICCQHKLKEKDDEPTNRDLLKIIAQQNEQLLLLQKQVAMLLNREHSSNKPIEAAPQKRMDIEASFMNNNCFRNSIQDSPRKKGLSKFSVDVMTSFEVAIRPQHTRQNVLNCKPKIQEITEVESVTETDKNEKTQSILLQEPLVVPEMCPSPEPSININMHDYDGSDDEVSTSEIGATFYHNLMGQVNNILRKAHVKTTEDVLYRDKAKEIEINVKSNKTMHRVKEATLKHLKNIGVTIKDSDDDDDDGITSLDNQSGDYSPTEISFAVKQLLMKYLPDDHLAKISPKSPVSTETEKISPPLTNVRPELSFASLQYMRKYNLIPSDTRHNVDKYQESTTKKHSNQQSDNKKILDITALKMQPKLL